MRSLYLFLSFSLSHRKQKDLQETLTTLSYASRARAVQNRLQANISMTMIRDSKDATGSGVGVDMTSVALAKQSGRHCKVFVLNTVTIHKFNLALFRLIAIEDFIFKSKGGMFF